MKKILFWVVALFLLGGPTSIADVPEEPAASAPLEDLSEPEEDLRPAVPSEGEFVSLGAARIASRLSVLEQRLSNLERTQQFLDGRMERLNRQVEDLRRRR